MSPEHKNKLVQLVEAVVSPPSNPSMDPTPGPSSAREGTSHLVAVLQVEGKDGYLV